MATIAIGPPTYGGEVNEDIQAFVRLLFGYYNTVNINPLDIVGGIGLPNVINGNSRAVNIFRSCLKGPAATWYDNHILKNPNWMLYNIFANTGAVNWAGLMALTLGHAGTLPANSVRPNSSASTYIANHPGQTVGAGLLPNPPAFFEKWNFAGGKPTDVAVNAVNAGNANPMVLQGHTIAQEIDYFLREYPTQLEAKRKLRFGSLFQEDNPVRVFYEDIKRSAELLGYGSDILADQFFRGLSPDNMIEAERIGAEMDLDELVNRLERVEKRKHEMKVGRSNKIAKDAIHQSRYVEAVTVPRISQQEPIDLKRSSSQGITQEQLDQLLKAQAEKITQTFQNQIQALQNSIPKQVVQQQPHPDSIEGMQTSLNRHLDDYNRRLEEGGGWKPLDQRGKRIDDIATRVGKKLAEAEEKRQERDLIKAMRELYIDDSDEMDTSNLLRGSRVSLSDLGIDENDGDWSIQLVRNSKKK